MGVMGEKRHTPGTNFTGRKLHWPSICKLSPTCAQRAVRVCMYVVYHSGLHKQLLNIHIKTKKVLPF